MKKTPLQTLVSALHELSFKPINRLALLAAACLASQSGFVDRADATVAIDADFTTYTTGNLTGQNSWAQVSSATNIANPIQVIAATASVPQSIKVKGVANAAISHRDLPGASQFNPVGATAEKSFHYVIENFRVTQALCSTTATGTGVCAITTTAGGTGTYLSRLFVRRFTGNATNTTQFDLGLSASGSTAVYGTTALAINTSYKVVVSYTANASPTLDVVKVYVNPVGLDPASWTAEISQTLATDPAASMKSFVWTPGAVSNSTINELTASRLMVGDTLSELLLPPSVPTVSAATFISENGFTANWSAVQGASKYYLDVATDSAFSSLVSGYSNLEVVSATSKAVTGSFSAGATLFYRVRSANANATSVSSGTQSVTLTTATEKNYVSSATTGSVNWNDTTVWSGAVAPASAEITTLTFDGNVTGTLDSTNDLTGNLTLNGLNVSNTGTGTLNLKGNPLRFVTNSVATGTPIPQITFANGLTATSSVQNNLILANDLSVSKATSAGNLTTSLDGVISGTGALVKKGGGTVTIFGTSNTYSGGTKVNEGQLTVNTINGSLGTGNITLGSGNTTGTLRWGDSFSGSSETSDKTITLTGTGGGGVLNLRGSNSLTLTGAIDTGSDTSSRAMQFTGSGGNLTVSGLITGNGKLRINGSDNRTNSLTNENNSFTGGVTFDGNISSKIYRTYVSKIGMAGANSPLGTNGTINFGTNHSGTAYNFLMWTSSVDETTDKVINLTGNLSGGLLVNKGTAKLKFTSNVTANALGSKTLYLDQDNVNAATELAGSIPDGDGSIGRTTSINKNGLGTLTLSGANTYTGNTTIKGGTLEVKNASALNAGSVIFADPGSDSLSITFRNTAVLKLACAGVNASLNTLVVGSGSSAINGRIDLGTAPGNVITFANADGWNASSILTVANTATGKLYISSFKDLTTPQVVSAENPTYIATFDSNGLLSFVNPTPPSGFSSWISAFNVADPTATGDSDNDGINNLLEYVLNGDPSVASTSILPSSVVTQSAFEFTFSRRADSKNDTTLTFQYGSTLAGWTDVTIPASSGSVGGATVTVTADGNSADTVKVSIPNAFAVGGKLFGRLKVAQ